MKFKSIVCLGLGFNQLEYVQAAKNFGYHIIGFDGNDNAVCRNLCDESYNIRIDNHSEIVELLGKFENLIGCISEQTDNALLSVGAINSTFNLPGPSLDLVHSIKDKSDQRAKCKKLDVEQPDFCLYESKQDFLSVAETFISHYKNIVIKPCEGQSSIAVRSFPKEALLECNSEELFKNLTEISGAKKFLVEEFVDGDDISIEGFVFQSQVHVLAISHKTKFENNSMVDKVLQVIPYREHEHKPEYELACKLVKGFSLDKSFFHIEAKKNGDSLSLIEWTPRGCGARLSSVLLSKMYDENMAAIRIGILRNDYELPALKCLDKIGLLQFFDSQKIDIELLRSAIVKHTKNYILHINNFDTNDFLGEQSQLLDGRSRSGNIIAVGNNQIMKSLSIHMSNIL